MGRRPDPRRISSMYGGGPSAAAPARAPDKATYAVRSLSFGSFPAESTFAPEYTRPGRAVDQVWIERRAKDGQRLLIVRTWDQAGPTVLEPEAASSVRVVVEVRSPSSPSSSLCTQLTRKLLVQLDTIDRACTTSDGVSLYLRLSRPPTFETIAVRQPYERPPWPRQAASLDAEHAGVADFASISLRLELRTAVELRALLVDVAKVGAPRVVSSAISLASTRRFDDTALTVLQSWLLVLDFRVAFQLEKLVRNGLVDAIKAVGLRDQVDSYVVIKGAPATERILALFAERLSARAPSSFSSGGAAGPAGKENEDPAFASARARRRRSDAVLLAPPDRPQVKRRKTEPVVLVLDSSDSSASSGSSDEDSDEDLSARRPPLALRRVVPEHPSHLSLDDLLAHLDDAAADSASLGQLLASADDTNVVRQVTVTPTRLILDGPFLADTNTVVRGSSRPDLFLSVWVRNEDSARLTDRNENLLESRFKPLFRNGFEVGGRTWRFLAWSSSGLKNGSCFFVSPHTHDGHLVTPTSIHRSIGDFAGTETALIPAKYMARIAQAFSSSKPTLELSPDQVLLLPDIESTSGSCFSDGVGLISSALAVDVVRALKLKLGSRQKAPTCFQFRMGGAKGTYSLSLSPALRIRLASSS